MDQGSGDRDVIATEAALKRKLLAEKVEILSETPVAIRIRFPNGRGMASIPRGLIDGGYTFEQLMLIEQTLSYGGVDLLPFDWH